jgi:hypothetical protein
MAEDYSLFDYPSEREDDRQPLWKPEKSKPEPNACIVSGAPAPAGSCEFVGGLPYEGALGRKCTLGSVCFLFANPAAYASCPTRTEKLSELKKLKEKT